MDNGYLLITAQFILITLIMTINILILMQIKELKEDDAIQPGMILNLIHILDKLLIILQQY